MSLSKEDLKILCQPFDEATIGVKVQSLNKDKNKAMLVLYLQHTDVYGRLELVDPSWSQEITDVRECKDEYGKSYYSVRARITLKGTSRENSGEGLDIKGGVSDALKRTAMLFGVGRYLYDSEQVWVDYNEQRDKYKQWTYAEYQSRLRKPHAPIPGPNTQAPKAPGADIQVKQSGQVDARTPVQQEAKAGPSKSVLQKEQDLSGNVLLPKEDGTAAHEAQPSFKLSDKLKKEGTKELWEKLKLERVEANWSQDDVKEEIKRRGYAEAKLVPDHEIKDMILFVRGNKKKIPSLDFNELPSTVKGME